MNKSDHSLNLYMLKGPLAKKGYDRWRHHFTGYNQETGTCKTFFVEYFACNPAIGNGHPIFGQLPINQAIGRKPSYAMVKVGVWGENAKQLHNFYAYSAVKYAKDHLHLKIGECELSETKIKGSCDVSMSDAIVHPEYMSDAGAMVWDLQIQKNIAYHIGRGHSKFERKFHALDTFWHAEGLQTQYNGSVILDGVKYLVFPETSFGYADKHWGSNFTSPWLSLTGCHLKSKMTGKTLENTAFVFKSGLQYKFGVGQSQHVYGGLYYEGKLHQFNQKNLTFEFVEDEVNDEDEGCVKWRIKSENSKTMVVLEMICAKRDMLLLNYEAPDGTKKHNKLWSGGTGSGTLSLYRKTRHGNQLVDQLDIQNAGCEYGLADK